jgi:hypothetical protein
MCNNIRIIIYKQLTYEKDYMKKILMLLMLASLSFTPAHTMEKKRKHESNQIAEVPQESHKKNKLISQADECAFRQELPDGLKKMILYFAASTVEPTQGIKNLKAFELVNHACAAIAHDSELIAQLAQEWVEKHPRDVQFVFAKATMCGVEDFFDALLKAGCELHTGFKDKTPMEAAVAGAQTQFLKRLIEAGAWFDSNLLTCVKNNNKKIYRKLLAQHVLEFDSDVSDESAQLVAAVILGQYVRAQMLIEKEHADVNVIETITFWSPIGFACHNGDKALVELLLSKGADIADRDAKNPLEIASARGHQEIVEILLAHLDLETDLRE